MKGTFRTTNQTQKYSTV